MNTLINLQLLILNVITNGQTFCCCHALKVQYLCSTLAFIFNIIRPIVFSAVKIVSFEQSRKFSLIKEFFYSQETFLQTKNFSTVKEIFHQNFYLIQEIFHKGSTVNKFSTKKFYLIKDIFQNQ